jgi:hypothetical protein
MTIVSQSAPASSRRAMTSRRRRAPGVEQLLAPHVLARLGARIRAGALDRALIAGARPDDSPQLAARAAALTSRRHRRELADGLDRLVLAASGPQRRWWALAGRRSVLANADALDELATLLRSDAPLYARGIALIAETLSDGVGPAYLGEAPALARRLSDAGVALSGSST